MIQFKQSFLLLAFVFAFQTPNNSFAVNAQKEILCKNIFTFTSHSSTFNIATIIDDTLFQTTKKYIQKPDLKTTQLLQPIQMDWNTIKNKIKLTDILSQLDKYIEFEIQENGYLAGLVPENKNQENLRDLIADFADNGLSTNSTSLPQNHQPKMLILNYTRNMMQMFLFFEFSPNLSQKPEIPYQLLRKVESVFLFHKLLSIIKNEWDFQHTNFTLEIMGIKSDVYNNPLFWENLNYVKNDIEENVSHFLHLRLD